MVDVDGVLSLFGFPPHAAPAGSLHFVEGIPHFLSPAAAHHLLALVSLFELVWCSGWEEKADEHLPHLLGLPRGLPHLSFGRGAGAAGGGAGGGRRADAQGRSGRRPSRGGRGQIDPRTWKLAAIDAYAGARALAWDRRLHRRRLPRLGSGARGADSARADLPRTGAHRAGGGAAAPVGRGAGGVKGPGGGTTRVVYGAPAQGGSETRGKEKNPRPWTSASAGGVGHSPDFVRSTAYLFTWTRPPRPAGLARPLRLRAARDGDLGALVEHGVGPARRIRSAS